MNTVVHIAYVLSQMNSCLLVVVTPMAQVGNCSEISWSGMCTFILALDDAHLVALSYLYFRCSILFMHGIWSDNTKKETVFVCWNYFVEKKQILDLLGTSAMYYTIK